MERQDSASEEEQEQEQEKEQEEEEKGEEATAQGSFRCNDPLIYGGDDRCGRG